MNAPVVTGLQTCDVKLSDPVCVASCEAILALPEMREWTKAARAEPEAIDELEVGF